MLRPDYLFTWIWGSDYLFMPTVRPDYLFTWFSGPEYLFTKTPSLPPQSEMVVPLIEMKTEGGFTRLIDILPFC